MQTRTFSPEPDPQKLASPEPSILTDGSGPAHPYSVPFGGDFCHLYVVVNASVCRLSVICLSVTFVHSTQAIEIFGNVSMTFGTLAIRRVDIQLPSKILLRSSQKNPSVGRGVKRKRGSQIERFWTYRRLYLGTVQDHHRR